jgi:hypothetical protein
MSEKEVSPVSIPCVGYKEMSKLWDLILDLLGGTQAMRDAGQKWLPMESRESFTSYETRLNRSILFNGLRDTLNKLVNKPFTHSMTVNNLPEEISYLENDVDGNGTTLETFVKEVLYNLIEFGIAHIYVDHTTVHEVEQGKKLTKADEKRLGVRVYLINISPNDLIGWQAKRINGVIKLKQIRYKETIVEPDGEFGDKEVNYIYVYNEENFEVYKQDSENTDLYNKDSEGSHSFGRIPLITIYANRTGFMKAEPPLMDLAWQNLAHWQSSSDQRNILRFSRFGIIFGKGLPDKMVEAGALDIGPSKAFLVESDEADMKYVEHTGKAIEAGQKDIEEIEQKMRVLGNQPLMKVIPNTATAERIDEGRTVSQLQSWINSLQLGIKQALKLACEWRKIESSADNIEVDIYSDFEALVLGGGDKDLLLKVRKAGEITRERFLRECQRRGVFSQDMDPEVEAKLLDDEEGRGLENYLVDEQNEEEEETFDEE